MTLTEMLRAMLLSVGIEPTDEAVSHAAHVATQMLGEGEFDADEVDRVFARRMRAS